MKKKKTVVLSKNPYVGRQGFCVSKEFSKKHKVTSVFDLTRPEVAKAMDSDGNGKGEIWIGAPGWASANVNEIKVRDYGLMAFMEPIRAEQSVMTARVGDSIKKKQGYAFYCYSPHAIWNMFDIVRLNEPKLRSEKITLMVQPKQSADEGRSPRWMTERAEGGVRHRLFEMALEKRLPDHLPHSLCAQTMQAWFRYGEQSGLPDRRQRRRTLQSGQGMGRKERQAW